jgi:hypothetical protein
MRTKGSKVHENYAVECGRGRSHRGGCKDPDGWAELEGLNKADYFMLAFFKRYSKLLFSNTRKNPPKVKPIADPSISFEKVK